MLNCQRIAVAYVALESANTRSQVETIFDKGLPNQNCGWRWIGFSGRIEIAELGVMRPSRRLGIEK